MSPAISTRPAAGLLAAALLLLPACASPPRGPAPGFATPRLHHLLDLEDARAPLAELEPFLRDGDPEVRARAALAVARKGGERAPALLELASRDPDARVREAVALGLGLTGDPDLAGEALRMARRGDGSPRERALAAGSAVGLAGERVWKEEAYGALFRAPEEGVRRAAFRTLVGAVRGWKEKPEGVPAWLLDAVDIGEGDPEVRACAAMALRGFPGWWKTGPGELEWDTDALARVQTGLLAGATPDVRAACAAALPAKFAGHDVTQVIALEDEAVPRVRARICQALGRTEDPEGTAALLEVLRTDPDFGARAAAAGALGSEKRIGQKGVEEALAKAAIDDPSGLVRVTATEALVDPKTEIGKAALRLQARSRFSMHRAAAAAGVFRQGGAEALRPLLLDPSVRVREAAVDAAGSQGREGLWACVDALKDGDPVVAAIAANHLGAMAAGEAREALAEALRRAMAEPRYPDEGADLRAAALEALGIVAKEDAVPFARALLGDADPSVAAAAAAILAGPDGKEPERPLPPRLRPFPRMEELRVSDEGAPRIRFETERGEFVVQTLPSAAPVAVARLLERVAWGGYDGTVFHRIVPCFVAQGGDPRGDGSGSGGATSRAEFSGLHYERGTLGVPRSAHPDSGGCQLFFCHGSTPHLDRVYTITGRVVEGLEVIDRLDLGDLILRARVE